MIQKLRFNLSAQSQGEIGFTGHDVQGVFFKMLGEAYPELASYLHDYEKRKTYSVTPILYMDDRGLLRMPRHVRKNHLYHFTVCIYSKGFEGFGVKMIESLGKTVMIGGLEFYVVNADFEASSFKWILEKSRPARSFTIRFVTPTCFKIASSNLYDLFPTPVRILNSMLSIFKSVDPSLLSQEYEGLQEWVSRCVTAKKYRLETLKPQGEYKLPGFIGNVTYIVDRQRGFSERDHTKYSTLLAGILQAATYTNIGTHKTMGMGVIQLFTEPQLD